MNGSVASTTARISAVSRIVLVVPSHANVFSPNDTIRNKLCRRAYATNEE